MFNVGSQYSRADIYEILNIPIERQGGDWQNGYHREGKDYYIFCNVGIAGRTGHDYDNHFEGSTLVWHGKTQSHFEQQTIKNMLSDEYRILVFYRLDNEPPFTYAGIGQPVPHFNIETPVRIDWHFSKSSDEQLKETSSNKSTNITVDVEKRKEVEEAAIQFVWKHYEAKDYKITDTQKDNCGYDLLASGLGNQFLLEVKGTALNKKRFFISRNERLHSSHPDWRLALVTNVLENPNLLILTKEEMESSFQMDALSWECNEK